MSQHTKVNTIKLLIQKKAPNIFFPVVCLSLLLLTLLPSESVFWLDLHK